MMFIEKKGIDGGITSKNIIKLLIFLSVLFIPFIAWRGWVNKYPEGIPFTKWSFNGDHIRFRFAFWRWLFVERLGKLILGVWGIFPFLTSLAFYKRKYHFIYYFLAAMFLYVSVFATVNIRHDYYQIYLIPSIALALGAGSVTLLERKSKIATLVLLFSVLMMFGSGIYQVKDFYQINHPEIIEAGKKVDEITPKDAWIIAPYNGDTAFLYQTKRYGWPAIDNSFENLIKKGADFYVTVTPNDADSNYVKDNFEIIYSGDNYFIADLTKPKQP